MTKYSIFLLALVMLLSGCSTMSKKDCLNADWYSMGLQDGRAGYASSRLNGYSEACAKKDVAVDRTNYMQGYETGIREFCQPNTGYQLGLKGRSLPNVCPTDLQVAFNQAYDEGYREYKIKQDVINSDNAIKRAESVLKSYDEQRVEVEAAIIASTNTQQEQEALAQASNLKSNVTVQNKKIIDAVGLKACANGNWFAAGVTDGLAGRSATTFRSHSRTCQDYHKAPKQSDYINGHAEGIAQYCTYDSGVKLGRLGRELSNICQGDNRRRLNAGYEDGLTVFNEKVTIAGLSNKKTAVEKNVATLDSKKLSLLSQLENTALTDAQRNKLSKQLSETESSLLSNRAQLAVVENELNCYVADWQALGFQQGRAGEVYNNTSLNCGQYGRSVNPAFFEKGYVMGVEQYCTFDNGVSLGNKGVEYLGVCPKRVEQEFLRGYVPAYGAFRRAELKRELAADKKLLTTELANVQTEIDVLAQDLERTDLTRQERLNVIRELSALTQREESVTSELELVTDHALCLTDDWFALGQTHGASGSTDQLRGLRCERFEITADTTKYRNGLARGLTNYCTQTNGYNTALAGELPAVACSKTTHRVYFQGIQDGLEERARLAKINELRLEKLDILEAQPVAQQRLAEINSLLDGSTPLSTTRERELKKERFQIEGQLLSWEERLLEIEAILN